MLIHDIFTFFTPWGPQVTLGILVGWAEKTKFRPILGRLPGTPGPRGLKFGHQASQG